MLKERLNDREYDPSKITYSQLLELFWSSHNPTHPTSRQYMSAIWVHDDSQRELAEKSMESAKAKYASKNIHTKIKASSPFYIGENYHQKFFLRNHRDQIGKLKELSDE